MERTDIVKIFLDAGYQLGADSLSFFESNPDKVQEFLNLSVGKLDKPIITKQTIDKVLFGLSPNLKVIKTYFTKSKESTAEEVANKLARRYKMLAELITRKTEMINLISVNRISEQIKKFSIIAMVKEINRGDRSLLVEDSTGTTSVYISDEAIGELNYIIEDEVIGFICDNEESAENRVIKIVFPDIPLASKIATSNQEMLCMFVSDIHMEESGFLAHSLEKFSEYLKKIKQETTVFVLGDISSDEEKVKKFLKIFPNNFKIMMLKGELEEYSEGNYLPDPVLVDIGGVKIFLSHGDMFSKYTEIFKTSPENVVLQLIKKRHLSPTFGINKFLDEEKLMLEQTPDIFVIGHFHNPRIINYKGVTIISLGSFITQPVFWSIDLKTRESIKIDLT